MRKGRAFGNKARSLSSVVFGMRPPVLAKYRTRPPTSSGHVCWAIWIHSGGTQVRPVTPCSFAEPYDVAGHEVVHEDDVCARR